MNNKGNVTRRDFLKAAAIGAGLTVIHASVKAAATGAKAAAAATKAEAAKGGSFTLWQIPSHRNNIGNSYVFLTKGGKVIVMDGGTAEEEMTLRGFVGALGGEVEAWFISHPHQDHMGALSSILADMQDMKIKHIYHSRISEAVRLGEKDCAEDCSTFYSRLASSGIPVTDIRTPGDTYDYDGMKLRILSVANDEFLTNPYNNSSMIMRVWDKKKDMVFLADAGIECGNKCLNGPFGKLLNAEYLQIAHHGQNGCDHHFYDTVQFRVALWPTPKWVWENNQGGGYNTGNLKTFETRAWLEAKGIKENHVSWRDGLWKLA